METTVFFFSRAAGGGGQGRGPMSLPLPNLMLGLNTRACQTSYRTIVTISPGLGTRGGCKVQWYVEHGPLPTALAAHGKMGRDGVD